MCARAAARSTLSVCRTVPPTPCDKGPLSLPMAVILAVTVALLAAAAAKDMEDAKGRTFWLTCILQINGFTTCKALCKLFLVRRSSHYIYK